MSKPPVTTESYPSQQGSRFSRIHWIGAASLLVFLVACGFFFYSPSTGDGSDKAAPSPQPQAKKKAQPSPSHRVSMGDRLAAEFAMAEPSGDDWDTEKFHVVAKGQLKELAKLISHPENLNVESLADLLTTQCDAEPLRPTELEEVYDGESMKVLRRGDATSDPSQVVRGVKEVAAVLRDLIAPLGVATEIRTKFKIYRVTPTDDGVETKVIYTAFGQGENESTQQNANWRVTWTAAAEEQIPRITGIFLESFEEVAANVPGGRALVDCTASVVSSCAAYQDQLLPGASYWSRRLSQRLGGEPGGYQGLALGDVNGDALDDIYVCQTGGLPNRLFVQQPDGTLLDKSAEAQLDWLDLTRSALFADLDNDGDQDLVLAQRREVLILENDGTGRFARPKVIYAPGAPYTLTSADYDNDGDLDIYVCCYGNVWAGLGDFDHHVPIPMQDASNGSANMLLQNNGDLAFRDVSGEVGLDENNNRWSLSAVWEDYDNDGDQDLYVANDFGRNSLYRNDGEPLLGESRFVDVAAEMDVEDLSPGMSANWGDCDNDGWMDLYVSNMFSGAGNRITFQERFQPDADTAVRQQFQRHARGNSLFLNGGGAKKFRDATAGAGVGVGRWAWSSTFADLNNDTLSDVLVVNGYVTEQDAGDL